MKERFRPKVPEDLDTSLYWRLIEDQKAGFFKGESRISRVARRVVKGFVFGGGIASVAGCSLSSALKTAEVREISPSPSPIEVKIKPSPTQPPTEIPTSTPIPMPTETPRPSPTPEPTATPTPEIIHLSSVEISGEFLTGGLKGIGTETRIGENDLLNFLKEYVSENWQEKIELEDLGKDPVKALKFLLSIGQEGGFDQTTFSPKEVFDQLEGLSFFRTTIKELPNGSELETILNASPQDLVIRKETHMTVVGTFGDASGSWAVVSFDRWKAEERVPYQHSAIIPRYLLEAILKKNNISFEGGKISFKDKEGKIYRWKPNGIEANFAQILTKATGVFWMEGFENPVVPYPPEALVGQNWKPMKTEKGRLLALDIQGKELAEAKYNEKTKKWEWEKIVEKLAAPKIEGLIYNEKEKKYYASKENLYGLKEKTYAGEIIEYTFNNEKAIGIVLTPAVVKILMEKANTKEVITKGEWKIPFPLDPRGEENLEIGEWFPTFFGKKWGFLVIKQVSPRARFVHPFNEERRVDLANAPMFGQTTGTNVPTFFGCEGSFNFAFPEGVNVKPEGTKVFLGDVLFQGVTNKLLGKQAPRESMVLIWITLRRGDELLDGDITDNILEIGKKRVFLASK